MPAHYIPGPSQSRAGKAVCTRCAITSLSTQQYRPKLYYYLFFIIYYYYLYYIIILLLFIILFIISFIIAI